MIKELSLLHKLHPGVPEVVLSLYLFNETKKSDKIIYMPWGRFLLSNNYVLNIGDRLNIDKKLFSINNRYGLTVTKKGYIYVYDLTTKAILYFINKTKIDNTLAMIIETSGISVMFTDSNKNEKSRVVLEIPLVKLDKCEECKEPYNVIIDNDTGNLVLYGNAFYNSTSTEFQNLIAKERGLLKSNQINIDNLDEMINNDKDLLIKQQQDYLYCNSLQAGCVK